MAHVLSRGNGRATVFHSASEYESFIALLDEACQRHPVDPLAFCLMPNHFHLVARVEQSAELSAMMQWWLTSHVRRHHRRHGSSGHLWQGRFGHGDGGDYFQLPITPDQSNAGTLEVPMVETAEPPGASGCLGPMTCWTELPAATTTGDGAVSLVGAGGEVGQPLGGIGLTWDAPPSYSQSVNSGTGGGGGGSIACPTTGAAYGCCTTRGGIQVVGFGISAPCTCPNVGTDTCAPRAGYCGCIACGGC